MRQKLTLDFLYPSLNDLIKWADISPKLPKSRSLEFMSYTILAITRQRILPMNRALIEIIWKEKDESRKPSSISGAGRKIIFESLFEAGILQDDKIKDIIGIKEHFCISKKNPGVDVILDDCQGIDYAQNLAHTKTY